MKTRQHNKGAQHKRPGNSARIERQKSVLEHLPDQIAYWMGHPCKKRGPEAICHCTEQVERIEREMENLKHNISTRNRKERKPVIDVV